MIFEQYTTITTSFLSVRTDPPRNLHARFREQFNEEVEIREKPQLRLDEARVAAEAEATRADRSDALFDDMRVVMTRLAVQPTAAPPAATPHAPISKPTRPEPYSGGRVDLRQFKTQLSLAMAASNYFAGE